MNKYFLLLSEGVFQVFILKAQVPSTDGTFTAEGTTDLQLLTGTIPRLTILNSNGNTGIGIAPTEMLHVNGNILTVGNFLSTAGAFGSSGATNLSFSTNGANRLTILNTNGDGRVKGNEY